MDKIKEVQSCEMHEHQLLSRNLPRYHCSSVNSEGRGKPKAAELPDDLADARVIRRLPDQATQVRCVKLPVRTRRSLDLIAQLADPSIRYPIGCSDLLWACLSACLLYTSDAADE